MRRFIGAVCIAVLGSGLIAGCSADDPESAPRTATPTTSASTPVVGSSATPVSGGAWAACAGGPDLTEGKPYALVRATTAADDRSRLATYTLLAGSLPNDPVTGLGAFSPILKPDNEYLLVLTPGGTRGAYDLIGVQGSFEVTGADTAVSCNGITAHGTESTIADTVTYFRSQLGAPAKPAS